MCSLSHLPLGCHYRIAMIVQAHSGLLTRCRAAGAQLLFSGQLATLW